MNLFESTLLLLLVAIGLLQVSRRFSVPYPTMLALAGLGVAALPWAPSIEIDPQLALALFIAPALLEAGYDLPPRVLLRNWLPLLALAAVAVLLTTAAVAWLGMAMAALPLAAAVALGAIVAPPDAAAAAAVLSRFNLPRHTVVVLKGESLLNDAVALLIFGAAVGFAAAPDEGWGLVPMLALAAPGGLLLGFVIGRVYVALAGRMAGTLGGTLFEFVTTFVAWIVAERLHLSAVLCVVAYAMTAARFIPERQAASDRVHSYAVWETIVFLLNILAFLMLGLEARVIVTRLAAAELWSALIFAGAVLLVVIAVRLVWVVLYTRVVRSIDSDLGHDQRPTMAQGVVVAWCGMRGLVTLAAALALPADFPSRDLILLSALAVVLGTLVVQGLTLGPLIGWLRLKADDSMARELSAARLILLDRALDALGTREDEAAVRVRQSYLEDREASQAGSHPRAGQQVHRLLRKGIKVKRAALAQLRRDARIEDDVFHVLERELDWAELASSPPERFEILEE